MRAYICLSIPLLTVLGWSCAGTHLGSPLGDQAAPLDSVMVTCETLADSIRVREYEAMFHIIDPDFCKSRLHFATSRTEFDRRVTDYARLRDFESRPGTPDKNEWWDEMTERMDYGRERYASAIYHPIRDVRWELLIQLGPPDFESRFWVDLFEQNWRGRDYFVLYWDRLGKGFACRSMVGGGYPVELIPWTQDETPSFGCSTSRCQYDRRVNLYRDFSRDVASVMGTAPEFVAFPILDQPIEAVLQPSIFPNSDGSYSLWMSALTPSDQFTQKTIMRGVLRAELNLYDTSGTHLGTNTKIIDGLEAFAALPDRSELAVPVYVGMDSLQPGSYEAILTISGADEENMGVYRAPLAIPSQKAGTQTSDLILLLGPGQLVSRAIERDTLNLAANPAVVVHAGDTLYPYVEFIEPDAMPEYDVSVWLIRAPKPKKHKTKVEIGPMIVMDDNGPELISSISSGSVAKQRFAQKDVRLMYHDLVSSADLKGRFSRPIPVTKLKRGNYYLVVRMRGRNQSQVHMSWSELRID